MGTFPRKVVISPDYGAGLSTWWDEAGVEMAYTIAESPALIDACERGLSWAETTAALKAAGFDPFTVDCLYEGGWKGAVVVTVRTGPYKIREYDGAEHVEIQSQEYWRH